MPKNKKKNSRFQAVEIFKEHYKFCSLAPTDLYEDRILDLKLALFNWNIGDKHITNQLIGLRSLGLLQKEIYSLIIEFQGIGKKKFQTII